MNYQQEQEPEYVQQITTEFKDHCLRGDIFNAQRIFPYLLQHNITLEDIERTYSLFILVCEKGNLNIATWLHEQCPCIFSDFYDVLFIACNMGHIDMAMWAYQRDTRHQPLYHYHELYNEVFFIACKRGHFHIAKWLLYLDHTLTNNDHHIRINKSTLNACISSAISSGITDHVIWLFTEFKGSFIYLNKPVVFSRLCGSGHKDLAMWFHENFKSQLFLLSSSSADKNDNVLINIHKAFLHACSANHIDIATWLLDLYPNYDCSCNDNEVLYYSLAKNNIQISEWLIGTFPKISLKAVATKAFITCSKYGHFETMKYLWNKNIMNDINLDITCGNKFSAFIYACTEGNTEIAYWLFSLHPKVTEFTNIMTYTLVRSTSEGQIEIVQWILSIKRFFYKTLWHAFHTSCKNGKLTCAKYILEFYNKQNIIRRLPTENSINSCCSGNLETLIWLHNQNPCFDLGENNFANFIISCKNETPEVAQWLYSKVDNIDLTVDDHAAFRYACEYGRRETAIWLKSLLPLQYDFTDKLLLTPEAIMHEEANDNNVYSKYYLEYTIKESVEIKKSIHIKDIIHKDIDSCSICLDSSSNIYTSCEHFFCKDCILRWLVSHKNCPYCKSSLTTDDLSIITSDQTYILNY